MPPLPNLQTQPFKDVYQLRAAENEKLASYGWVDKEGGVTHIPIDRAMEVMLQRGFPVRADGGGDALNVVTRGQLVGTDRCPSLVGRQSTVKSRQLRVESTGGS